MIPSGSASNDVSKAISKGMDGHAAPCLQNTVGISYTLNEAYAILDARYPEEIRFLDERNPFQFLVSVILSAQTTDENVNKVAPRLFAAYPDAEALSNADIEDIKAIVRRTGFFNSKARHIVDCAKALCERHGGRVPSSMDELLALPGVGRKTANCVRANAMGLPGIVVDTHFSRVVSRLLGLNDRNPMRIESIVAADLPIDRWSRFSMTANSHGRDVCHASRPSCDDCPLRFLCTYGKTTAVRKTEKV